MKNPFEVYTSISGGKKSRPLDWDESALDTQRSMEAVLDEEREAPRLFWLWAFLVASFLALGLRVFYLQIVQGSHFRLVSENNRVRSQVILAPRGLIKDRNGQTIVQNTASFNLVAVPFDLPKEGLDQEIAELSAKFGLDIPEVADKLKKIDRNSIEPVVIKQDLSHEQSILFDTESSRFIGFSLQQIPIRQYQDAKVFSHLLGYTGIVSGDELKILDREKYDINDYIGKLGIEQSYESYLHGINGEDLIEVDARGRLQNILGKNDPQPGQTLVLNIDKDLQELLYKELSNAKSPKAAAVAMDPRNGQVLALVSLPGFDNNLFAQGISPEDYSGLLKDPNQPLFNRAIAGTYPPGSTVKPMVATAGLQEGVISPRLCECPFKSLIPLRQYGGKAPVNTMESF